MQANKIENPEIPIQKNPELNDRDIINDFLATEKYMTDGYSTAMNEASNQTLYENILQLFTESQNNQRHLYNLMFKNGWYTLEQADQQQITQAANQFSGYLNQFSTH